MEKQIKDFEDYTITENGEIYSYKWNRRHKLVTSYCCNGRYEDIKLSKNNKTYHKLVHRLVAETFIPNPLNLPEVDHIDKNTHNNCVSNLRWCDRKFNLEQSYETMSPVRNYKIVELTINDKHIAYFKSITLACRYASKLGYSKSSLQKYYHCRDAKIIQIDVTTIENEEEILTEVE